MDASRLKSVDDGRFYLGRGLVHIARLILQELRLLDEVPSANARQPDGSLLQLGPLQFERSNRRRIPLNSFDLVPIVCADFIAFPNENVNNKKIIAEFRGCLTGAAPFSRVID